MKSEIKTISDSKREIELEIEAHEVSRELEKIVNQYSSRANLDGFRIGKAPKDMVKRLFYPEIRNSLIDFLAPKALTEIFKNQNINPITVPVISDLYFEEGHSLRFKASFEVWPEFELPDYKKIRVKRREINVDPKEIDQSLEELRQKSAEYVPVQGRGVVAGDYVVAELQGKHLKTKKFFATEKVVILAGHADNEKVLNESLIGLKPNESREFVLRYDKDHKNKKLAGKEIEYRLKVITIKEKKIPDINDDFAKDLGKYENLGKLKEEIENELKVRKEDARKEEMASEIVKKISDQLNIELPETLVEQESRDILKNLLSSLSQQELKKEISEDIKAEARRQAEQNLKRHLILRKIAEKENLSVTEEEIDQEIKAIARANNIPLPGLIENINREGRRETLRNRMLIKKTVDFLVEKSIIE